MTKQPALTADEQKFNDIWNEHLRAEFSAHSADETLATMVANPRINQVPVMIGGDGREEVYEFYAKYFAGYGGGPGVADHRSRKAGR